MSKPSYMLSQWNYNPIEGIDSFVMWQDGINATPWSDINILRLNRA